jgi:hypothetical protein
MKLCGVVATCEDQLPTKFGGISIRIAEVSWTSVFGVFPSVANFSRHGFVRKMSENVFPHSPGCDPAILKVWCEKNGWKKSYSSERAKTESISFIKRRNYSRSNQMRYANVALHSPSEFHCLPGTNLRNVRTQKLSECDRVQRKTRFFKIWRNRPFRRPTKCARC